MALSGCLSWTRKFLISTPASIDAFFPSTHLREIHAFFLVADNIWSNKHFVVEICVMESYSNKQSSDFLKFVFNKIYLIKSRQQHASCFIINSVVTGPTTDSFWAEADYLEGPLHVSLTKWYISYYVFLQICARLLANQLNNVVPDQKQFFKQPVKNITTQKVEGFVLAS